MSFALISMRDWNFCLCTDLFKIPDEAEIWSLIVIFFPLSPDDVSS